MSAVNSIISALYSALETQDLAVVKEQFKKMTSVLDVNQIDRTAREKLSQLASLLGLDYDISGKADEIDHKHNDHVFDPRTGMNVPISEEVVRGSGI